MLVYVLIIIFEVGTSSNQVKRMRDGAGDHICHEGREWWNDGNRFYSFRLWSTRRTRHFILVELAQPISEEYIDRIKEPSEWNISYQADFEAREERTWSFFLVYFLAGVVEPIVFVKPYHF